MPNDGHTLVTFDRQNIALANPAVLSPHATNAMGKKPSQGSPSQPQPMTRLATPASPNVISDHAWEAVNLIARYYGRVASARPR